MNLQYTPYTIPLLVGTCISVALAVSGFRRRATIGAITGAIVMVAVAEWSFGYALQLASAELPAKIFWGKVKYFGVVLTPCSWLCFALQYTGHERWLNFRNLALLAIEPLLALALVWSNELHGIFYNNIKLDTSYSFNVRVVTHGIGFWVHTFYSYLIVLIATFLILRALVRLRSMYRGQTAALLIASLSPWVGNFLYVSDLNPFPNLDLTPFAFILTGFAVRWGMSRFRIMDIVPIARDAVMENMKDGVIVLDLGNRIVDLNPAAANILGRSGSEAIGQPAEAILSGWPDTAMPYWAVSDKTEEITVRNGVEQRYCEMRVSPLYRGKGRIAGRLIVLRDITDRKRTLDELQRAHDELERRVEQRTRELMSEIEQRKGVEERIKRSLLEKEVLLKEIHHRVKNNLQIISSLLNLQSGKVDNPEINEILAESQSRVRSMALIHEELYHSEDLSHIDFGEYLRKLTAHLFRSYASGSNITLRSDAHGVVLGLDQAIPCALIVNELVSNALKHAFADSQGGEVLIDFQVDQGGLHTLAVCDNGVGLPEGMDFRETESLGLQLVVNLTHQLEGDIQLDPTGGTTFRITFAAPQPRQGGEPSQRGAPASG